MAEKKKKKKQHVCFIMDRSGSMDKIKVAAVDGYNEQVQQVKADASNPELDLDIDVSLLSFNKNVFEHLWCAKPEELEEAAHDSFKPTGTTSMFDAMGYAIDKFQAMDDAHDEDVSYLLIVISDGDSNDDKIYGKKDSSGVMYPSEALAELLEGCKSSPRWTITYMGCGEKNIHRVARSTGVAMSNMAACDYEAGNLGVRKAMRGVRQKLNAHFTKKAKGEDAAMNFYSDSESFADYSKVSDEDYWLPTRDGTVSLSAAPAAGWPNLNNPYVSPDVPQTFGTADVFAASNCVIDNSKGGYQRPKKS